MTPHWLFFPTQSAGDKLVVTGTAASDLSSVSQSNITSEVIGGVQASDFTIYPHTPLRKGSTYMELLIRLDTAETYASNSDFQAAETLNSGSSSYKIGGNTLPHTSISISGGRNLMRFRFNASSSDVTTFRNLLSAGDAVEIILNW